MPRKIKCYITGSKTPLICVQSVDGNWITYDYNVYPFRKISITQERPNQCDIVKYFTEGNPVDSKHSKDFISSLHSYTIDFGAFLRENVSLEELNMNIRDNLNTLHMLLKYNWEIAAIHPEGLVALTTEIKYERINE